MNGLWRPDEREQGFRCHLRLTIDRRAALMGGIRAVVARAVEASAGVWAARAPEGSAGRRGELVRNKGRDDNPSMDRLGVAQRGEEPTYI